MADSNVVKFVFVGLAALVIGIIIAVVLNRDERRLGDNDDGSSAGNATNRSRTGASRSSTTKRRSASGRGSSKRSSAKTSPTWSIPGVVQDPSGAVIEGAGVRLESTDSEDGSVHVLDATETDAEGRFVIEIPVGSHGIVRVSKDRFDTYETQWAPDETLIDEEQTERSFRWPEVPIELAFETAIQGRLLLEDGEPAQKGLAAIQFFTNPWGWTKPIIKRIDDPNGAFYIGGIRPGNYRVWGYREGYVVSPQQIVKPRKSERVDVEIRIVPGGEIRGVVRDKRTDEPIPGVVIYAPLQHVPGSVDMFRRKPAEQGLARNVATTDGNGAFHLFDLGAGEVIVRFLHSDYRPLDHTYTVTVGTPTEGDVAMTPGTGFRGQVLDQYGSPITTATVLAFTMNMANPRKSESTMSRVDAEGNYHVRNLNPGGYIVVRLRNTEEGAGSETKVLMSSLSAEKDTVLDFIDEPTLATLSGIITDPKGDPAAGVSVTAMLLGTVDEDFSFETAKTDEDGRYEIRNLKLSTYSIGLARGSDQSFGIQERISFSDASDHSQNFVFFETVVSGTATSKRGSDPIEGAEIILLRAGDDDTPGDFMGRALTGVEGRFELRSVPAGRYVASARAEGFRRSYSEPFEVRTDSSVKDVAVKLDVGATMNVRVANGNGEPIVGARVIVLDDEDKPINLGLPPRTDSMGSYSYGSLSSGRHAVVVSIDGETKRRTFTARAGKTTSIDIVLD